jgi:hypothetical protein
LISYDESDGRFCQSLVIKEFPINFPSYREFRMTFSHPTLPP